MTKRCETKEKILSLLGQRQYALTELSSILDISTSTIHQHLMELLAADAIRIIERPPYSKWKYYTLVEEIL